MEDRMESSLQSLNWSDTAHNTAQIQRSNTHEVSPHLWDVETIKKNKKCNEESRKKKEQHAGNFLKEKQNK